MPGNIIPISLAKIVSLDDINSNSMLSVLQRGEGIGVTNIKTITTTGVQNVNIFQLVGVVEALSIFGLILDATALTNCGALHFDLWDGALSTKITKDGAAAISGLAAGSGFYKSEINTSDLTVVDNTTGAVSEFTGKNAFSQFILMKKTAADTYIRFNYNAGAAINATFYFSMLYRTSNAQNYIVPV